MKHKRFRIVLIAAGILVLFGLGIALSFGRTTPEASRSADSVSAGQAYFLQEYNGRIGVYRVGEDEPFRLLDVYISTLPVLDQAELRQRIYIQNEEQLRAVIEDYES